MRSKSEGIFTADCAWRMNERNRVGQAIINVVDADMHCAFNHSLRLKATRLTDLESGARNHTDLPLWLLASASVIAQYLSIDL
jgi:hypothetical protein